MIGFKFIFVFFTGETTRCLYPAAAWKKRNYILAASRIQLRAGPLQYFTHQAPTQALNTSDPTDQAPEQTDYSQSYAF
jgi:hypothetical protein